MTGQNFETLMPYVTQQLALINIKVKQVPLSGANAIPVGAGAIDVPL